MFERFTERARQVIVFAQEEARRFKHDHIATEHILLGVLREEQGLGARVQHRIRSAEASLHRTLNRRTPLLIPIRHAPSTLPNQG